VLAVGDNELEGEAALVLSHATQCASSRCPGCWAARAVRFDNPIFMVIFEFYSLIRIQ